LLFISTGRGNEQRMVRRYYAAAQSAKQLWEVPEAAHANGWLARPEAYAHQLVSFFDQALLNKERPAPPEATVQNFQGKTAESDPRVAYDATLSLAMANLVAILMAPLAYLLLLLPYQWVSGQLWTAAVLTTTFPSFPVFLLLFVISIFIHEGLHLLGYVWVGKVDKTAVKMGMNWKMLTPYAHCKAPLTARAYRIAVFLPGLVLGILPGLAGVVTGSFFWVIWGALMLITAGGDAAVLWAVRRVPAHALVLDHPSRAGCHVLKDHEDLDD
jgi:hypothetical protein